MAMPNGIDYLYSSIEYAVNFCNSEISADVTFDPAKTKINFVEDLMSLSAYSICADGEITLEELKNVNQVLGIFDLGLGMDEIQELKKIVNELPFEIPKTLRILVLKAELTIKSWKSMGDNMVKLIAMNEMLQLSCCLSSYANIMMFVAIEGGLIPHEKKIVSECMKKCYDFVVDVFGDKFIEFCDYKSIEEQINQW